MKPLFIFFGLACLISWLIWLPLYGPALGLNGLPVLPLHHALGGLGPMLAAWIVVSIFYGSNGRQRLTSGMIRTKPFTFFLVALMGPHLLALLAAMIGGVMEDLAFNPGAFIEFSEFPNASLPVIFLYNFFFFGFGEETGWRGFLLPVLQKRLSILWASVVLTLLWTTWHWPLFLYRPGYTSMDAAAIFGWFFSLLTGSFILSWLYNSTRGSILVCAVFHTTIDLVFTAGLHPALQRYLGALIIVWGIAAILHVRSKKAVTF